MRRSDSSFVALAVVALSLVSLAAIGAQAGGTPEQQCQATKNRVAGKYAACRQGVEAKLATTGDTAQYTQALARCASKFGSAWQRAIDKTTAAGATCLDAPLTAGDFQTVIDTHSQSVGAALAGGGFSDPATCGNGAIDGSEDCDVGNLDGQTCVTLGFVVGSLGCDPGCRFDTSFCFNIRFLNQGDTVWDLKTGLEWEKKVSQSYGPHDVLNTYTWGDLPGCSFTGCPNGTAFTDFLGQLDECRGIESHPSVTYGSCGWRLPTLYELSTIVDLGAPGCGTYPNTCIDPVFGPTSPDGYYLTRTTKDGAPGEALGVQFSDGTVSSFQKVLSMFVRAVRGGGVATAA